MLGLRPGNSVVHQIEGHNLRIQARRPRGKKPYLDVEGDGLHFQVPISYSYEDDIRMAFVQAARRLPQRR